MEQLGRHSARIRDLRQRLRERQPGQVVVDGRRLIADLVSWGVPLRELYVATDAVAAAVAEGLVGGADNAWEVADSVLHQLAPTRSSQGVVAIVDEPRLPEWDFRGGIGVYLERVQEPGNVGAIIRAAAALGAETVLLSVACADPFHWSALRASAGAVFRLPVQRIDDLRGLVETIHGAGGETWAADSQGTPADQWSPRRPALLLLGSEGGGLQADSCALADGQVSVPLERGIDSLNVAVAAGVLLERFRGQRRGR